MSLLILSYSIHLASMFISLFLFTLCHSPHIWLVWFMACNVSTKTFWMWNKCEKRKVESPLLKMWMGTNALFNYLKKKKNNNSAPTLTTAVNGFQVSIQNDKCDDCAISSASTTEKCNNHSFNFIFFLWRETEASATAESRC